MGLLGWAFMFLIVAIIAAIFGFSGIAVAATEVATILFYIFLFVFILLIVAHLLRRPHAGR